MFLILQSLLYKWALCNKLQQCYGMFILLCSISGFSNVLELEVINLNKFLSEISYQLNKLIRSKARHSGSPQTMERWRSTAILLAQYILYTFSMLAAL